MQKYGARGRFKTREDLEHHFRHVETSYTLNNSAFFTDYAAWLNGVLTSRNLFIDQFISQAINTLEKASRPAAGDSI